MTKDIEKDRQWMVAKSHEIVLNSRYSLTVLQQKMLSFMIAKIRPQDHGNEEYIFDIKSFCEAIGLAESGYYYRTLKQYIKDLRDSSVWIKIGKKEVLLAWLNTAEIDEGSGSIKIKFHETVQPYLFELKNRFVSYRLNEILTMRSKHSIRLYEMLKAFAFGQAIENGQDVEVSYTPEQLQKLLDAESYTRYYNLKQRVLLPAIKEINALSEDIHIEMDEYKQGKAVSKVVFIVSAARAAQILTARENKERQYAKRDYQSSKKK